MTSTASSSSPPTPSRADEAPMQADYGLSAALLPSSLTPLPTPVIVFLVLAAIVIAFSLFVRLVLPLVVSRLLRIAVVGSDISIGKIKLWAVEQVSVTFRDMVVEVERVSLQRNDFAANSYFTLKAERARLVKRASESVASSPPGGGGQSLGLTNFEILVSKLLALLAVFSFVVEELVVEVELFRMGDRKKLLSVTRLGNVVILSPSLTAPSLPPPPASPHPNYQPHQETIAASQPQPSAKCLVKKLRQTFCLTSTAAEAEVSAASVPDIDFNLPHTTHIDASVRDGVKIELSDGGFVAFNSLDLLSALTTELGSTRQRKKGTDGLSSPSERRVSVPLLPSIKVITNMFCVRTFSAEMRLNMVSAWYHGENDATLSIRNIGSHSLVTGEQVLSVRSLRAEKLQDCAELTFEDLRGSLNGAVIVLFGKMEPYHENLDFELRIASGSVRRRNEGTEVTLLQTRLYGLGDREIFATEAASAESASSMRFSHCIVRQVVVRPGQRDIELLLLSALHVKDKANRWRNHFSKPTVDLRQPRTSKTELALAVDVDNLVFDLPWKRSFDKSHHPPSTDIQFGFHKATLEFRSATDFSLVVKRWRAATLETQEEPGSRPRSRSLLQSHKSILFARNGDAVKLLTKGMIQLSWFPFVHKMFYDCGEFVNNLRRKYLPRSSATVAGGATVLCSFNVNVSDVFRLDIVMQRYTMTVMTKSVSLNRDSGWQLELPYSECGINGVPDIVKISQLNVRSSSADRLTSGSGAAADARSEFEEKSDATNRSVEVSLVSAEFAFPYQMNVHEAYSGELLCIVKWLKRLHGAGAGQTFRAIHPDILIFAKSVSFVVPDDPFEVRLRENFELLEDEFLEAEKRSKLIEEKINDLRRTHIMLPSTKVDELYANLKRKNADIYVKRSINLKQSKMRTRLMELSFSAVEFFILSDSSLTGKQTMCDFMIEVEPEAVWPFDLDFSTMYFKWLRFECKSALVRLRDYPQPLIDMRHVLFWGRVCLAEQMPTPRAVRRQTLTMDRPDFEEVVVERSLYSYKLYQDIAMDMDYFIFSHGPCWEPVVSQVTLALNFLTGMKKSDPSPPLTWWDKLRYLNHGRLLLSVKTYKLFLHTSPDPYNTTEEIELNVSNAGFRLINNEFVKLDGSSLDVFCRTASKYDDCRLVHVPNFVLSIAFDWLCNGNAKDHHSVALCAAENAPDYSSNLVHDSYRAFRSHNVNIRFNLETKSMRCAEPPKIHMFSSTIRWLESLKWLFAGTSRPIRRGKIFANLAPRKTGFFRHFKEVTVSFFFHQIALDYWSSASMEKGFLLSVAERGLSFSGKYGLRLVRTDDGLIRRPRSNWIGHYTNCEFGSTDVWFQSIVREMEKEDAADENDEEDGNSISGHPKPPPSVASSSGGGSRKIEKNFFLSVESIQFNREIGAAVLPNQSTQQGNRSQHQQNSVSVSLTAAESEAMPSNCLIVNGARGAWTISNRDLALALYESWRRAHILRNQISENSDNVLKPQMPQEEEQEVVAAGAGAKAVTPTPTPTLPSSGSPNPSAASSVVGTMFGEDLSLNKLLSGTSFDHLADFNSIPFSTVYSEEQQQHTQPDAQSVPEAKKACSKEDSLRRTWVLKFVNCQVLLKGTETEGYLILSSSKAEAIKTVHRPVWKDENLLSKNSWSGSLECMQYFATVAPNSENILRREEEILWLTRETIGDTGTAIVTDVMPGAGDFGPSVGGVVCKGVMAQQLQRIVSNCTCEFYYVSYGDDSLDAVAARIPKRPDSTNLWSANREEIVNCFSLVHHDLNVCTNSLQYSMILDVLNNLLLFVDPTQRSRTENYLRMKYQMMLSNEEDHRSTILQLQTQIRQLMCQLRDREKYEYSLRQARTSSSSASKLGFDLEGSLESLQGDLEDEIAAIKENVTAKSEELDLRMRCLLDLQTIQSQKGQAGRYGDEKRGEELRQKSEIIFSRAQWRLTETDGQLGIADASIINFSYTKSIMMNESTDHLVEMGYLGVKNLLKEQLYADVILPTDLQNVPVDRQRMLRVFCRAKGKVGGISVHDHFEINLAPLTIGITQSFYTKIIAFCFPEKTAEAEAASATTATTAKDRKKSSTSSTAVKKSSSFYVESPLCKDDVEQMKERAQLNKLFNYIKIPEVPICVSYKGEKEKNKILDVAGFLLQVPTIEYHRVHWTWLDLLLAVKSRVRESLISQAFKQKLGLKNHSRLDLSKPKKKLSVAGNVGGSSSQQEDDAEKAKMLFGDMLLPTSKKK